MDRFDYTKPQREFLNAAVALNVIDAVELMCMGSQDAEFAKLRDEIIECAFLGRHTEYGRAAHSTLIYLADKATQHAA